MKLSVLPVEKAAQNILAGKYDSQRLLIVVRKPDRLLKLVELGVPIKRNQCWEHVSNKRNTVDY